MIYKAFQTKLFLSHLQHKNLLSPSVLHLSKWPTIYPVIQTKKTSSHALRPNHQQTHSDDSWPGVVAHAYNPNTLGGLGERIA